MKKKLAEKFSIGKSLMKNVVLDSSALDSLLIDGKVTEELQLPVLPAFLLSGVPPLLHSNSNRTLKVLKHPQGLKP